MIEFPAVIYIKLNDDITSKHLVSYHVTNMQI